MKKILGLVVLAFALTGCGGPLEDDGTDVTGAARQELDTAGGPRAAAPQLKKDLFRSAQDRVIGAPAFQEQMHLTNPIHGDCK